MKMKPWLILAVSLSAGLLVQHLVADDQPGPPLGTTNTPPPAPLISAPALTPEAPAKPAKKKKAAVAKKTAATPKKSAAAAEPMKATGPLGRGPAIVTQKSVNVRGQAAINSEVITRLQRGDRVTVLDLVTKKPKLDEPANWAKVALPTNAAVWVNHSFINAADKTVVPKKLNVRSGPGENYSVIGRLAKGTVVKEIETKGDWLKIEPPAETYGFIAAHLLSNEPAAPPAVVTPPPPVNVAVVEPPKPPPTETVVSPPVVPAPPTEPAVPPVTPPVTPPVAPPVTPTPPAAVADTNTVAPPPVEEVLVKRVVSREGIVKRSVSIQAPTYFTLASLDTGRTINYLYSSSTNLVLKDFQGKRILVTGEEMLDERWPNTPVISVDSLQTTP